VDRFHVIKHPLGGSDVYDSEGKQVGYSLPAIIGEGEDFYDMQGNPVGMSFDDKYGMSDFMGNANGSYGYLDQEVLMGRNAWLHGNPFEKDEPELPSFGTSDPFDTGNSFDSGSDFGGGFNSGNGFDSGSDW